MTSPDDTPGTRAELATFLPASPRPEGALPYHGAQGFLFAIAASPRLVPVMEWFPAVFGDDPLPQDREALDRLLHALSGLYDRSHDQVWEDRVVFPEDLEVYPDPLANMGLEAPLGQWSAGFARGIDFLEEVWDEFLDPAPEEVGLDFVSMTMLLSLFADSDYARGVMADLGSDKDLEQWAADALEGFGATMAAFAELGRFAAGVIEEGGASDELALEPATEPVRRQKVGRNEPCPCGSGRKYKKCCGANG